MAVSFKIKKHRRYGEITAVLPIRVRERNYLLRGGLLERFPPDLFPVAEGQPPAFPCPLPCPFPADDCAGLFPLVD